MRIISGGKWAPLKRIAIVTLPLLSSLGLRGRSYLKSCMGKVRDRTAARAPCQRGPGDVFRGRTRGRPARGAAGSRPGEAPRGDRCRSPTRGPRGRPLDVADGHGRDPPTEYLAVPAAV